jgi:hypothetical protein
MFEITNLNVVVFALCFLTIFYVLACAVKRGLIKIEIRKVLVYITIFSLLGVVGEIFVNTLYANVTGVPLWEYRLLPVDNGSVSYFFIFVWGSLGFYKYISEVVFPKIASLSPSEQGLLVGAEAVFIELLYNGAYFLLFSNYIFYYFPDNLGPLSHLSCLQVIPFYFIFGFVVNKLLLQNTIVPFHKTTLVFYWFVIITIVWIV